MKHQLSDSHLLGLALGTFNVALLVLLIVLPLHLTGELGDLLEGLNTVLGLSVFGVLWVVTCYCTYRGINAAGLVPGGPALVGPVLRNAFAWGAYNGVIFFNLLLIGSLIVVSVESTADGDSDSPFGVIVFAVLAFGAGTVLSSVVGSIAGVVFATVDALLLRASRWLVG
jgi:hypothetical protein